ncbi:hypothetical protein ACW5R3_09480 [Bizionia sp. KMM 8389]
MNSNELKNIKQSGFKTPDNYFQNFEDNLLSEIAIQEQCDSAGFKVPDNYFENFNVSTKNLTPQENSSSKVIPLFAKKSWLYAASIAAIAILVFTLPDFNQPVNFSTLDNDSIENYILANDYEATEFNNLITDPAAFENTIYNEALSDTSLENYMYNNSELEDLHSY